jgi:hypothetical protein
VSKLFERLVKKLLAMVPWVPKSMKHALRCVQCVCARVRVPACQTAKPSMKILGPWSGGVRKNPFPRQSGKKMAGFQLHAYLTWSSEAGILYTFSLVGVGWCSHPSFGGNGGGKYHTLL